MTTISTKSRALNVWAPNDSTSKLRVDFISGVSSGYETRIAHSDAFGTYQPIQFPGPLVFYDGSDRYEVAPRFASVEASVSAEQTRALAAEAVNAAAVETEKKRALAAEGVNAADISTEKKRAEDSEGILTDAVVAETAARIGALSTLSTALTSELGVRAAADVIHTTGIATNVTAIGTNATAITDEVKRAGDAESTLQVNINSLSTSVFNLQESTASALSDEVSAINASISTEAKTASDATTAEKDRAVAAEAGLQSQISALLSNTDAVALNSLAELVADYSANGGSVTSSLNAALARIDQLEATIAALQARDEAPAE